MELITEEAVRQVRAQVRTVPGLHPLHELLSRGSYLDTVTMPMSAVKERNPQCRHYQYWPACMGGCRAIAIALTKDLLYADPSKCIFFKEAI